MQNSSLFDSFYPRVIVQNLRVLLGWDWKAGTGRSDCVGKLLEIQRWVQIQFLGAVPEVFYSINVQCA